MHSMYWRVSSAPFMGRWYLMRYNNWWIKGSLIALFVLTVALLVVLIVTLIRRNRGQFQSSEAFMILQRRYVNGEIDKETYERIKKDLR